VNFLDNIEQIVAAYPLLAFGVVFLAGVLSSASPCVLATIPLVVGFVGGYADGDRCGRHFAIPSRLFWDCRAHLPLSVLLQAY